jgi:hypothetical protein
MTGTKGTMIAPLVPTVTGGPISSYVVAPALPAGLTLNASTGVISGTPTVVCPTTDFQVTAYFSGGSTSAKVTMTINDVPPPVAGPITVHLNQAIQMPDDSVPMVAGRTMFFQVFMNDPSVLGQPVTAELYNGSTLVTRVTDTLPATMTTTPTNLKVPGTNVVNGYTYHVSVGSTLVTGTLTALTVPKVPTTIVPLICGTITGVVNKEALEKSFLRVYPVPDDLDIHYTEPMVVPGMRTDPLDKDVITLLNFVDQKRVAANDGRYYLGVWTISDAALLEKNANGNSLRSIGGLNNGKSSVMRSNASEEEVFPHEFGHAFGLTDISETKLYPYPNFEVLGYGVDIVVLEGDVHLISDPAKSPNGKRYDLMAYASPHWISDFHYKYLINAIVTKVPH